VIKIYSKHNSKDYIGGFAMEKLRAVFYARVSTQEEQQLKALPKQIDECKDCIKNNGWELIDGYIDEGKSGTKTKGRDEYRRLLEDIEANKFDIIVVKSQDRLNRNTRDWYIFTDKLNTSGKKLFLYMDNKFYVPSEDALITGIKAILAEEYSRDLSKKINNSHQRRIEKVRAGEEVSAMGTNMAYGHYIKNGKWEVDEKQAEIVKMTYELYLKLSSIRKVCRALNEMGYRNQAGRPFLEDSIRRILRNERNMGVNVLNRYHRDFDKKKIIKKPKEEWVYQEGACAPIVSKETWHKANTILDTKVDSTTMRGKKTGADILSGKLFCKNCGKVLWQHKSNGYKSWYCAGYYGSGKIACDDPKHTTSVAVMNVLKYVACELIVVNRKAVKNTLTDWLKKLKASLSVPVDNSHILKEIEKLEAQRSKLLEAYLEEIISKEDYTLKYNEVEHKILEKKQELIPVEENEDIKSIENVLKNLDKEIDEYLSAPNMENDKITWLLEHTKKITVCSKEHYIIELDLIGCAIIAGKDFFTVCNGTGALSFTNGKYKVDFKFA
jgi:DNA invertase Pin-like site-specific DNA recombinase